MSRFSFLCEGQRIKLCTPDFVANKTQTPNVISTWLQIRYCSKSYPSPLLAVTATVPSFYLLSLICHQPFVSQGQWENDRLYVQKKDNLMAWSPNPELSIHMATNKSSGLTYMTSLSHTALLLVCCNLTRPEPKHYVVSYIPAVRVWLVIFLICRRKKPCS